MSKPRYPLREGFLKSASTRRTDWSIFLAIETARFPGGKLFPPRGALVTRIAF